MKVLVCGGRDYADKKSLYEFMDRVHREVTITEVIHGDAQGADSLAKEWAIERQIKQTPFPAKWEDLNVPGAVIKTNRYGKKYNANAGPIRNALMLSEGKPEFVVAFPGGNGTSDMIKKSIQAKILVYQAGDYILHRRNNIT